MRPKDGHEVASGNPRFLFDPANEETIVQAYAWNIIQDTLVPADVAEEAKKHRLAGEAVPLYPWTRPDEQIERFGQKAREMALKILRQEQDNFIEYYSPYMRMKLERALKSLKVLVPNEKLKLVKRRVPFVGVMYVGVLGHISRPPIPNFRDIICSEDGSTGLYELVTKAASGYVEIQPFIPYASEEIKALYAECERLASPEVKDETEETAKTE